MKRADFFRQPSVELLEDPIPPPPPGSLELLKLKLNEPNAVFTADELAGYYHNTLNMASVLNYDELNKFYDIVNNSIQVEKSQPTLYRLNILLQFLINAGAHPTGVASVRRRLFGGKSRSRTTNKGRKSRKSRKTRKHRTLRK